jgi:hypothetical protein
VQSVPEQRHRPRQHDHNGLRDRGQTETGQADQQGAAPGGVGLQRVVDLVGTVMAVGAAQFREPVAKARPSPDRMIIMPVLVRVAAVSLAVAAGGELMLVAGVHGPRR